MHDWGAFSIILPQHKIKYKEKKGQKRKERTDGGREEGREELIAKRTSRLLTEMKRLGLDMHCHGDLDSTMMLFPAAATRAGSRS